MASTNKTPNYELSQFIATDKPSWLGDINDDMLKIDTGIAAAAASASGAASTASTAASAATAAQATADKNTGSITTINETLTTINANLGAQSIIISKGADVENCEGKKFVSSKYSSFITFSAFNARASANGFTYHPFTKGSTTAYYTELATAPGNPLDLILGNISNGTNIYYLTNTWLKTIDKTTTPATETLYGSGISVWWDGTTTRFINILAENITNAYQVIVVSTFMNTGSIIDPLEG